MGRRCRALLPMSESPLQPRYSLRGDLRALAERKNGAKRATTIGTRISFSDTLRVRRPVEKAWLENSAQNSEFCSTS